MSYTNGLDKPSDYFNTVLYTGTGSTQSITGVGFQPDLVWWKCRSLAKNNGLTDAVRGNTKRLISNDTSVESTVTDYIQSFDSNGFTVGSNGNINSSGDTFCSWNWLAGGTASSNTDGSITSSVSASTTSGFSIVSYTGTGSTATVGHGLGTAPAMVIAKTRDNGTISWVCYHQSLGANGIVQLNNTTAAQSVSGYWGTPNSTTFGLIGGGYDNNRSGENYIAYCFAEKKGFSKFGSYNGNAGVGAFVNNFQYLGFKPALVLIKCYNAVESWNIFDNKRNGYNYQNNYLVPNTADAETSASNTSIDLLSNGFNPYYGTGTINRSGKSYIYMAFAENPFVTSTGIPATAR